MPKKTVSIERKRVFPGPYGISRPPYHVHYLDPLSPTNSQDMSSPSLYPTNHMPGYGDLSRLLMLNRGTCYSGYTDGWPGPSETCPHNAMHHHSSCSCSHWYERSSTCSKGCSHGLGPMYYNPRPVNPPTCNFHGPQAHIGWPSELSSELGGFVRSRPNRVVRRFSRQRCCFVAGGAPFITCHNCFELLQLPKKLLEKKQKETEMCSAIILFSVTDNP